MERVSAVEVAPPWDGEDGKTNEKVSAARRRERVHAGGGGDWRVLPQRGWREPILPAAGRPTLRARGPSPRAHLQMDHAHITYTRPDGRHAARVAQLRHIFQSVLLFVQIHQMS